MFAASTAVSAGAAALSHDLWVNVVRHGVSSDREELKVARGATVVLGTSTATAWQTIGRASQPTYGAGDQISSDTSGGTHQRIGAATTETSAAANA